MSKSDWFPTIKTMLYRFAGIRTNVRKQVDNRDIFAIWGKFFTAPSSYHPDVSM